MDTDTSSSILDTHMRNVLENTVNSEARGNNLTLFTPKCKRVQSIGEEDNNNAATTTTNGYDQSL